MILQHHIKARFVFPKVSQFSIIGKFDTVSTCLAGEKGNFPQVQKRNSRFNPCVIACLFVKLLPFRSIQCFVANPEADEHPLSRPVWSRPEARSSGLTTYVKHIVSHTNICHIIFNEYPGYIHTNELPLSPQYPP